MKVVKVILLVLLIGGLSAFSIVMFLNNKKLSEELVLTTDTVTELDSKINQLTTELNDARSVVQVYKVGDFDIRAGATLRMDMLNIANINGANYLDCFITEEEINDYLGKKFKTLVTKDSILIKSMFREKSKYEEQIYQMDIVPPFFPVGLREGDYIDINIVIPPAHTFKVMSHREVSKITESVLTINVSPAEEVLMQQVYSDTSKSGTDYVKGVRWYVTKYIEDDENQIAFYPVDNRMEPLVNLNPNINDKSRLINKNVRRYVDYLLTLTTYNEKDYELSEAEAQYFNQKDANVQGAFEKDLADELGITDETKESEEVADEGSSSLFSSIGG